MDRLEKTVFLIDNHDSFSYNLLDYIQQSGGQCIIKREDLTSADEISEANPQGIVFSPGPEKPSDHPLMYEVLKSFHSRIPILGICLGCQAIGEFFGATVTKAQVPVHGKTSLIRHIDHPSFRNIPYEFNVTRYHSLNLINPEQKGPLVISSYTKKDKVIMSIAHKTLPIWGYQFHPEAILTEYGKQLIYNWIELF